MTDKAKLMRDALYKGYKNSAMPTHVVLVDDVKQWKKLRFRYGGEISIPLANQYIENIYLFQKISTSLDGSPQSVYLIWGEHGGYGFSGLLEIIRYSVEFLGSRPFIQNTEEITLYIENTALETLEFLKHIEEYWNNCDESGFLHAKEMYQYAKREVAARIIQKACANWIDKPICKDGTHGISVRIGLRALLGEEEKRTRDLIRPNASLDTMGTTSCIRFL